MTQLSQAEFEATILEIRETFTNNAQAISQGGDLDNITMMLLIDFMTRTIARRQQHGQATPVLPSPVVISSTRNRAAALQPIPVPPPLTPPPFAQLNKVRALGKVKADSLLANACSICLDPHKTVDSVTTKCGHQFYYLH